MWFSATCRITEKKSRKIIGTTQLLVVVKLYFIHPKEIHTFVFWKVHLFFPYDAWIAKNILIRLGRKNFLLIYYRMWVSFSPWSCFWCRIDHPQYAVYGFSCYFFFIHSHIFIRQLLLTQWKTLPPPQEIWTARLRTRTPLLHLLFGMNTHRLL